MADAHTKSNGQPGGPGGTYARTNRDLWDAWTDLHRDSDFYGIDRFEAGETTLRSVEIEEIGNVSGLSLLHLQCHFGLDTLSWARRGARVTGVDFSGKAIALARRIGEENGIPAEFICTDLRTLHEVLDRTFDIVYTSYGVLAWIEDIEGWAGIVARYLEPGGTFYIVEFHPLLGMLDDDGVRLQHGYFHARRPMRFEETGSYASPDAHLAHTAYQWAHGLGEIVSALIGAGLEIEFLHEFPYSTHRGHPALREAEPGRYVLDRHPTTLPLMFSLRATK